jgi:predicted HicB family RNase H-like nuclease
MKNAIKYKEFIGSVQYSAEDEVFYGKIEGINDHVSFEGDSVSDLKLSFEEAVDDYIELCESKAKPIYKSYKGSFNVRITPSLHQDAARKSIELGISLNQLIEKAIRNFLESNQPGT